MLRKYQLIVNQAAGTNNLRRKDVPQAKNGTHIHGCAPTSYPNTSKVPDDKSHINGKIKITHHSTSEKSRDKPTQPEPRSASSCSNNSQPNATVLRNGSSSVAAESLRKNVNTQESSKRVAAVPSVSKNESVINGSNSPCNPNLRKVVCDTVSATGKKRHLDVPSVNSDYTNRKRAKLDSSLQTTESLVAGKAKLLNGTITNAASESKVFSCKVSPDLKCTIRSEPVKPAVVSSPSLSIKSSSSKQDLTKPDVVNKPRKVETTEQLIQKLRMNGELCSIPSQTIYKFTSNQIVKEQAEEVTVVPDEVKPKSLKKRNKPQPPATTGDLSEVKNELVQKFLRTSVNSSNSTPFLEPPEIDDLNVECRKTSIPVDISKLDPNSEEYKKELLRNPWAFLPPVPDEEVICDHEKESQEAPGISPEIANKLLNDHWPGVNGQYDFKNEWRPFDRAYSITNSCNSYLHILPYVCLN